MAINQNGNLFYEGKWHSERRNIENNNENSGPNVVSLQSYLYLKTKFWQIMNSMEMSQQDTFSGRTNFNRILEAVVFVQLACIIAVDVWK